jgi:hypothetical protein
MSPSPSTAVPSETTATVLRLIVYWNALSGVVGDRQAHARDAGRVGHREVVAGLQRMLVVLFDLAAHVQQERAIGGVDHLRARSASIAARIRSQCSRRRRRRRCRAGSGRRRPRPGRRADHPAGSPIARSALPSVPGASSILTRMVRRYCALGVALIGLTVSSVARGHGMLVSARRIAPRRNGCEQRTGRERIGGRSSAGSERRLFLIDGNSLVYRAFFALPESIATSTGVPTNAIFGFASMLVKIVTEYGAADVVVWDAGTSGRKELFAEYKAQRRSRPDLLKAAVAGDGTAGRGVRLPQRARRGLRGRRRDRLDRRAGAARRARPCR